MSSKKSSKPPLSPALKNIKDSLKALPSPSELSQLPPGDPSSPLDPLPDTSTISTTLSTIWESVFYYLCSLDNNLSLSELNTLSAIIQKLIYSQNSILFTHLRTSSHKLKSEEHELKSQKLRESLHTFSAQSKKAIPPETIDFILKQVGLL